MSKELVVSTGKHETRVAILEDDQLVEIFHEREKEYSLAGSIHKGRVTRVLPGMQSAFVDIGLERDAFLYVSDFFEDNDEYDAVVSTVEEKVLKMESRGPVPVLAEASPATEPAVPEAVMAAGAAYLAPPPEVRTERPNRSGGDRPGGDRGGGDRGGGDQGGRGRRGRRRRGGRGGNGGIPESKFYSPRNDVDNAAQARTSAEPEIEDAEPQPVVMNRQSDDDFMVLPGESLAKYADAEPVFEAEPAIEAEAVVEVEESEPEIGSFAAWATPDPKPLEIVPEVAVVEEEPAEEPLAAAIEAHQEAAIDEVADPGPIEFTDEPEEEPVEQVPDLPTSEAVVEYEEEAGESEVETASSTEEPVSVTAEEPLPEDEGPEPARIPTSLTAALREQGHRYPHRVSRRMRRKMRGGPGEDREKPAGSPAEGEIAEAKPAEVKVVAPQQREERPPQHDRGGRDRNRGDRPERGGDRGGERGERPERSERSDRGERSEQRPERVERERPILPSISDLLKEGQEIIVQIAKEPLGQKGARITSHIALPGRFVVYMPTVDHAGVSRKIPSDEERQRLKRIVQTHRQGIPGGFICRTAAENKSEEELKSDMHFLYNLWLDMRAKAEKKPAPVLLHHDLDLVQRILRDQLTTSFKNIWVDNEELYESVLRFAQRFQPALVGRVKLYTRTNPIFDEFGITNELEKALRPKVWLKSGGYIVINQTEALVAIDINTGKYVGKSNRLEDTIVKVNSDAIKEIVRQIRLRDLGGIIVVDFIDMDERKNRTKVMQALEEAMRADRAPYKILQFNDFGLVAITRKRVKQSLERTLCSPCSYCEGAGYIKSAQTVIGEILQEAQRMRKALEDEHNNIVLRVNPEVGKLLKSNHNQFLQEIEEILGGKSVLVKSDPLLHQTKFDLA
jgi:ribonuclease G